MEQRFAVVVNGVVRNIVVAPEGWQPPEGTAVPLPDNAAVGIGWALDENGEFVPPSAGQSPAVTNPATSMSKYRFRRRFTLEELVKMDNPELFVQMTPQQKAIANTLRRSFEAAMDIDLNDSQLQYAMQLMVDWGLLTPERKQQILDPAWRPDTGG